MLEDSIACTAIAFDSSRFAIASVLLNEASDGAARGWLPAERLATGELVYVLVLRSRRWG